MQKFGWCFIGTGSIANTVAKELIKSERSYIESVYNRTEEKGINFTKKYGGKYYADPVKAMESDNVSAVYISLTNDLHYEYCLKAINLKKNVLLEKPFTINAKETIELIEAAKRNNVYIAEAMWTWFNDTAIKAKELVKKIGNINRAKISFGFPIKSLSKKGRLWDIDKWGGALLDLGVYPIRYAYELFGIPKNIKASSKIYKGIDTNDSLIFEYDGFNCEIKISITSILSEVALVKGDKGEIKVPWFHCAHKVIHKSDETKTYVDNSLLYGRQFSRVEDEIISGKKESSYVSLKSTLDIMKIMDVIRKQIGVSYKQDK